MMKYIYCASIIASISFTITWTSIFESFREWVAKIHPQLEKLIFCPWCLSHYVAFVFVYTSDVCFIKVSDNALYQFLADSFSLVGVSGIMHYVLLRAYEPVHKMMGLREAKKQRKEKKIPPSSTIE